MEENTHMDKTSHRGKGPLWKGSLGGDHQGESSGQALAELQSQVCLSPPNPAHPTGKGKCRAGGPQSRSSLEPKWPEDGRWQTYNSRQSDKSSGCALKADQC